MKTYTASELRRIFPEIFDEASRSPVIITSHNKPTAVLMSWEAYQALIDSFDSLIVARNYEELNQGLEDFHSGRLIDWEHTIKALGLDNRLNDA